MGSVDEKVRPGGLVSGGNTLLEEMKLLKEMQDNTGQFPSPSFAFLSHSVGCLQLLVYMSSIKAVVNAEGSVLQPAWTLEMYLQRINHKCCL